MSDIRISDSSVTSSAIRLRGAELSYGWNNLIENEPIPSKFLTSSDAQTEIQYMGWENPIYTIRGFLDESSDKIANGITFSLLKSYAKSTGSTYIYEDTIATTGTKIKIDSFSVNKVGNDKESEVYAFSIKCVETI